MSTFAAAIALALATPGADVKTITYAEASAVFQARCNSCHNGDKKKGGLALDTFATALEGGASGKVIEPADLEASRLWELVSHQGEPNMPPNSPRLPDAELDIIKRWIEAGAPETAAGAALMPKKPKLDFKLDPSAVGKPVGPPAMPEGLSTEPAVVSARPNAITALAASPWAPLVAVSGYKQVLLYNTDNLRLVGVLPFAEGTVHCLKFTRDGGLLLAGGGRGGQSGRVVVWDVKSGQRLFEVGKEYDAVLTADISPDRSLVALGGPSKVLRVYNTADGGLAFESKKHTEWVTAIEFSPDGVLLASGDRNGGLVVWEAGTGREFYDLRGHNLMITDVSWRLDSNVLASASEDSTVRLWEMQNGKQIKSWNAHGGGTTSATFAKDGRIVTTGRDKLAKLWDGNGGAQRSFEPFADLALRAVVTHDGAAVVAGDWSGEVRVWSAKDGNRLGNLVANPAPVAVRFESAKQAAAQAQAAADAAAKELAALQQVAAARGAAVGTAQQNLAAAQKAATDSAAALAAAEGTLNQARAAERATADTLSSARFTEGRLSTLKAEADRALASRTAAAQAAASTRDATKTDRDRMLAETALAAQTAAAKQVESSTALLTAATATTATTQAAAEKATAARVAAEAPLPALRTAAQAAKAAVPTRQAELTAAQAAKTAADKLVADKAPAVQALAAQAAARKADADALAIETQSRKATTTAAARP